MKAKRSDPTTEIQLKELEALQLELEGEKIKLYHERKKREIRDQLKDLDKELENFENFFPSLLKLAIFIYKTKKPMTITFLIRAKIARIIILDMRKLQKKESQNKLRMMKRLK